MKMRLKDRGERISGSGQRNLKIEKSGRLVNILEVKLLNQFVLVINYA